MSYPAEEENTIVSIGVPSKCLTEDMEESMDPCVSKIGGKPVWHDASSAPIAKLVCRSCNSADSVLMVAQIYVPIERDRSLYIFCCNNRVCSLKDEGWIVIRNQARNPFESRNDTICIPKDLGSQEAPTLSVWGELPALGGATQVSAFADLSSQDDNNDDLLAMLKARDDAIAQNGGSGASERDTTSPPDEEGHPETKHSESISSLCWRPARLVDHEEDQRWEPAGDSDSEDESGGMVLQSDITSDGKVQELLERYLAEEEDEELVRSLERAGSNTVEECGGQAVDTRDEHEEEREEGGKEGAEGGSCLNSWDKKLLRTGDSAKAEWHFQHRVASQPRQVLRYAYGGSPLWNSQPSSKARALGGSVSPCEGCGACRVFEMQLMPAILTLGLEAVDTATGALRRKKGLNISLSASTAGHQEGEGGDTGENAQYPQPTASQLEDLRSVINDGLDFGVVAVWVCPNSCMGSSMEEALVSAPADF